MSFLEVRGLKLFQGRGRERRALTPEISFTLKQGSMVALLGPNGAGKTTLLRTFAGLHDDFEGEIFLEGKKLSDLSAHEKAERISVVLTGRQTGESLRLRQMVSLGRIPHTPWLGELGEEDERVIDRAIELSGLNGFQNRLLREMSDGEKQKAFIARAIAQEPRFFFLDEPTAFLDTMNRASLTRLLASLTKNLSILTVFSTHDLDLAVHYADEILALGGGHFECLEATAFVRSDSFARFYPLETLPPIDWLLRSRKDLS